jgi:hypothetical protein
MQLPQTYTSSPRPLTFTEIERQRIRELTLDPLLFYPPPLFQNGEPRVDSNTPPPECFFLARRLEKQVQQPRDVIAVMLHIDECCFIITLFDTIIDYFSFNATIETKKVIISNLLNTIPTLISKAREITTLRTLDHSCRLITLRSRILFIETWNKIASALSMIYNCLDHEDFHSFRYFDADVCFYLLDLLFISFSLSSNNVNDCVARWFDNLCLWQRRDVPPTRNNTSYYDLVLSRTNNPYINWPSNPTPNYVTLTSRDILPIKTFLSSLEIALQSTQLEKSGVTFEALSNKMKQKYNSN